MKQVQITTDKGKTVLLVEVGKEDSGFMILSDPGSKEFLEMVKMPPRLDLYANGIWNTPYAMLPTVKGKWQILGRASELTTDLKAEIQPLLTSHQMDERYTLILELLK